MMFFPIPRKKYRLGYSLSEVIITITIVGVIAALSVPSIMQNTKKTEYVRSLQKAYAVLSNATDMIIATEGSPVEWLDTSNPTVTLHDMYKKYIHKVKECNGDCANIVTEYKNFNGASNSYNIINNNGSLILPDGTFVRLHYSSKNCTDKQTAVGDVDVCAYIHVDVNGAKGPNRWGKDSFRFYLTNDGLLPTGSNLPESTDCRNTNGGQGCTARVLRDGEIDYW